MRDWTTRLPDRPLLTVVEVHEARVLPDSVRGGPVTLWGLRSRIRTGAVPRHVMVRRGHVWYFQKDKLIEWLSGTTNGPG